MIYFMEMEFMFIKMEIDMKVIGKMERNRVKVNIIIVIRMFMRVIIRKIKRMDLEYINIPMEIFMKVNFSTTIQKEEES